MKIINKISIVFIVLISVLAAQTVIEQYKIDEIIFTGNEHVLTKDLTDLLKIKGRFLFKNGSNFNQKFVSDEKNKLINYYHQIGYLRADIQDSIVYINQNYVQVYFQVNEGKQYFLKSIDILGNVKYSDNDILNRMNIAVPEPLNILNLKRGIYSLIRDYSKSGYPTISISDSLSVGDSVKLYITVKEGHIYTIDNITIPELEEILSKVIRREIIINSGDVYNIEHIEESQKRLFETNLFNSVSISPTNLNPDSRTVDLDIRLTPSKFTVVNYETGIGQDVEVEHSEPVLTLDMLASWSYHNIKKSGRRFKIATTIKSIYPTLIIPQKFMLNAYYTEPWFGPFRVPTTVNPFYQYSSNTLHNYEAQKYGLRLISNYNWFRKIKLRSNLEWSKSKIVGVEGVYDLKEDFEERRLFSIDFRWDTRNDYLNPSKGLLISVSPSMTGYVLGGENHFFQLNSNFSQYIKVSTLGVLAYNVSGGYALVDTVNDIDGLIPLDKRFFLGGSNSIRGYLANSIGPNVVTDDEIVPTGGNIRFYGNLEWRQNIYGILGYELFLDGGYLWKDISFVSMNDLLFSGGFGLTLETPIGPARIDIGFPWQKNSNQFGKGKLHLAITHAF
jgi:outer membrane protein insertion porin family